MKRVERAEGGKIEEPGYEEEEEEEGRSIQPTSPLFSLLPSQSDINDVTSPKGSVLTSSQSLV